MTASRISALATLPLFHPIRGRKVVVAGNSQGASWKAELLTAAGAEVARLPFGWTDDALAGAVLAVGDFADSAEAARFAEAGRRAGALVNVVDQPALSDMQFGTIVNRSPIVIGISTDGAAPMLGQAIRTRIEAVLPLGLSRWADAAKSWRGRLKQAIETFSDRRSFWQRFVAAAWASPDRSPTDRDFDRLVDGVAESTGRVTLVGAGPGDAELLTLKAVRALQSATFILYDNLVGPDVLELARREARRVPVGKTGHGQGFKQSDINRLIVELALAGENVVRLKGGDPMIFGRATEEIEACRQAGVDIEVVPGISAAQGAATSLLVSLTERDIARRVQFISGHGSDGHLPDDIDWRSVADRTVTTVLYMPRATLAQFVRTAIAAGLDPATPAIAIASATLADEQHVSGDVTQIASLTGALPASAPVTVILGWVARKLEPQAASVVPFPTALAS